MKKFLLATILLLASFNTFALDKCLNGSWYSTEKNGEGISLEVLTNGQVVAYFYTYSAYGQEWFLFTGESIGDSVSLSAYDTLKYTDEPWRVDVFKVGNGSIQQVNSNTIIFNYDFVLDLSLLDPESTASGPTPWCLHTGCTGSELYTRLTTVIPCGTE